MPKKTNEKYIIESHAKDFIETHYWIKKGIIERTKQRRYFKTDYFEELAAHCGVDKATINQIHARNLSVSYITAVRIADFIGCEVTDIWKVVEK